MAQSSSTQKDVEKFCLILTVITAILFLPTLLWLSVGWLAGTLMLILSLGGFFICCYCVDHFDNGEDE